MKDIVEISMTTKVEDFILIPSPGTQKSYRNAIRKFEDWTSKPIASLLKEEAKILFRILEKYYAELKKRYKQKTYSFLKSILLLKLTLSTPSLSFASFGV